MTAPIPPVVPPGHMSSAPQPELPLPCGALLRPWTPPDAPALAEATHDPDIAHWNRNPRLDPAAAGERIAR
ncbi:hypothetical protein [Streptomyces sp. NPDC047014]|uniref:GNAT family N-acetyltransferase n=1 Tax=Streptomyces sp. NPDC047014 TaxID=3155736 RepID=UPI0033FD4B66